MTVVTCHQPNYLPGLSVVEKVAAADAVIWLDEVQFSHGGWSNRNRMPDGSLLTVPVSRETNMAVFNRVQIADRMGWREEHARRLRSFYGDAVDPLLAQIARPYRLLIGLNLALLRILLADTDTAWHFQSHLDGGRTLTEDEVVSDDPRALAPISERLAAMVAEVGGTRYLSGPSGRSYLDEGPFRSRGLDVEYFDWRGRNHCSAVLLRAPALAG